MAKRFTMTINSFLTSFEDNGVKMTHKQIVKTLNALDKENKELKFELKECREHKLFSRRQLEEENKQLKEEIEHLKKQL